MKFEENCRSWQEYHAIATALHEPKSAEQYASALPHLTVEEIESEIESETNSLETTRRSVKNNEMNGYGETEGNNQMRRSVETYETKIRLLQEELARR